MPILSKSFRVLVLGGGTAPLIESGTEIPTCKIRCFSTVDDNQHAIEIIVLRGEFAEATDNEPYGRYLVHQVPEGPRGSAKVEVRFEVDHTENLNVTALDLNSGKELRVERR